MGIFSKQKGDRERSALKKGKGIVGNGGHGSGPTMIQLKDSEDDTANFIQSGGKATTFHGGGGGKSNSSKSKGSIFRRAKPSHFRKLEEKHTSPTNSSVSNVYEPPPIGTSAFTQKIKNSTLAQADTSNSSILTLKSKHPNSFHKLESPGSVAPNNTFSLNSFAKDPPSTGTAPPAHGGSGQVTLDSILASNNGMLLVGGENSCHDDDKTFDISSHQSTYSASGSDEFTQFVFDDAFQKIEMVAVEKSDPGASDFSDFVEAAAKLTKNFNSDFKARSSAWPVHQTKQQQHHPDSMHESKHDASHGSATNNNALLLSAKKLSKNLSARDMRTDAVELKFLSPRTKHAPTPNPTPNRTPGSRNVEADSNNYGNHSASSRRYHRMASGSPSSSRDYTETRSGMDQFEPTMHSRNKGKSPSVNESFESKPNKLPRTNAARSVSSKNGGGSVRSETTRPDNCSSKLMFDHFMSTECFMSTESPAKTRMTANPSPQRFGTPSKREVFQGTRSVHSNRTTPSVSRSLAHPYDEQSKAVEWPSTNEFSGSKGNMPIRSPDPFRYTPSKRSDAASRSVSSKSRRNATDPDPPKHGGGDIASTVTADSWSNMPNRLRQAPNDIASTMNGSIKGDASPTNAVVSMDNDDDPFAANEFPPNDPFFDGNEDEMDVDPVQNPDPFAIVPFDEKKDDGTWFNGADPFATVQPRRQEVVKESLSIDDSLIETIRKAASRERTEADSASNSKHNRPDPSPTRVTGNTSDSVTDFATAKRSAMTTAISSQRPYPKGLPNNAILASMLFRQTHTSNESKDEKIDKTKNETKEADTKACLVDDEEEDEEEDEEDFEDENDRRASIPTNIVADSAASTVSSVSEEASSFYQRTFQVWNKQANNALNQYHRARVTNPRDTQHNTGYYSPDSSTPIKPKCINHLPNRSSNSHHAFLQSRQNPKHYHNHVNSFLQSQLTNNHQQLHHQRVEETHQHWLERVEEEHMNMFSP